MRKFLASLIVAFASLITYPLNAFRRGSAIAIARERLSAIIPVNTGKGELLFCANSRRSFHRGWNIRITEPDTIDWIDTFPDEACFWDIGANVGVFSLYAALNSNVTVLAFEPSGSTFATLNENIKLNEMAERIAGYCVAFSENTELNFLNMETTIPGHAMHGFGTELNQYDKLISVEFKQGAIGFCMDDFVKIFSPPSPTHIKIDVDGLELDIIRGARDTLSLPTVQSVIVEIEQETSRKRHACILELMSDYGFNVIGRQLPDSRSILFERKVK